jgi:transcriptional regulator with XRE-family HTH domain
VNLKAGLQLRAIREKLGLTVRDVETASCRIAARKGNEDFALSISRVSEIEAKGNLPSIHRLYSLSVIYRHDLRELMAIYGVDVNEAAQDLDVVGPQRAHRTATLEGVTGVRLPVQVDPGFDPRRTFNLGRVVEKWGIVPVAYLEKFVREDYTYAYLGMEDFTMYPILLPGSFVQVDESLTEVAQGGWRNEYERPIYFVETREEYVCCWCALENGGIILQPHPLSPVPVRRMRHPQQAEVIGQVVGVAMRLGDWQSGGLEPGSRARPALS